MAQYYEDFRNSTVGAFPTGWEKFWGIEGATYTVETSASTYATGGRRLKIAGSALGRKFLALTAALSDTESSTFHIRMIGSVADYSNTFPGLYIGARGSGPSGSENMVGGGFTRYSSGSNQRPARMMQYRNGTFSVKGEIGEGVFSWAANTIYEINLYGNGSSLRITVATAANPTNILRDATDTTDVTAGGALGIILQATDAVAYVYNWSAGTGGDSAPTNPLAPTDTTAPILTGAGSAPTGNTAGSGAVTTDEANGTIYAIVTNNGTTPTAAQVIAGNNAAGSAARYVTSKTIDATGTHSFAATGLLSNTAYFWHFVHRDAAGNNSAVVTSPSFTTGGTVTKGVDLVFHDKTLAQHGDVTGIIATWWDNQSGIGPHAAQATGLTMTGGVFRWAFGVALVLNVGEIGHLKLFKVGATTADDWQVSVRVPVQNIA